MRKFFKKKKNLYVTAKVKISLHYRRTKYMQSKHTAFCKTLAQSDDKLLVSLYSAIWTTFFMTSVGCSYNCLLEAFLTIFTAYPVEVSKMVTKKKYNFLLSVTYFFICTPTDFLFYFLLLFF
jgi:hypothetical protein